MPQRQLRLCIAAAALFASCELSSAATAFPADFMKVTTNLTQPVQWPAYEYDRWGRPYYAPRSDGAMTAGGGNAGWSSGVAKKKLVVRQNGAGAMAGSSTSATIGTMTRRMTTTKSPR